MKIAQVSPAYPPASGYGGGPEVCEELSKNLSNRGHSVEVHTTVAKDRDERFEPGKEVRDGIGIRRTPLVNNWATYKYKLFIAKGFRKQLKEIETVDVFHVHDLRTPLSVSAVREARARDIPVVLQPHGTVPHKNRLVYWKRLFDKVWGRELFEAVDHWFSLNSREQYALLNKGVDEDNITIIPNGIDLARVPDTQPGAFRASYNIPSSDQMILYLGRLHRSKRIDLLLEAVGQLNSKQLQVVIAGPDDGDRDGLKKKCAELGIKETVRFVGRIPESDKWEAYRDADLFVTPSFFGFPLTFLEAMSQQTPVLTTSIGDTLDEDGNNGVFVVEGTEAAIRQQIDELLEDSETLTEAGRSAYRRVQNEYTWERIVDRVEATYEDL